MTTSATQRAKRALAAREKAGARVIRVILSPAATSALARLTAQGATMTDVINAALLAASPPPASDVAGFLAVAERVRAA